MENYLDLQRISEKFILGKEINKKSHQLIGPEILRVVLKIEKSFDLFRDSFCIKCTHLLFRCSRSHILKRHTNSLGDYSWESFSLIVSRLLNPSK